MRIIISKIHAGLSFLTLAALVAQFFLAGLGIFGAEPCDAHRINGYLIELGALLLALGLIGQLGRARIEMSAVLIALMIALIEAGQPWIEALHPVVVLPIMGVSFQLAPWGQAAFAAERIDPACGPIDPAGQRR